MSGAPSNQPCLTVLGGPMSGTKLVIEDALDDILIGSDPSCTLCIPLPGVSPVHARIWLDASGATVHDTHSERGLYVNDDPVNAKAPLKNGDILWLGTPGEDAVVMIQCRLPRTPAPPPPVFAPAPEVAPVFEDEVSAAATPPAPTPRPPEPTPKAPAAATEAARARPRPSPPPRPPAVARSAPAAAPAPAAPSGSRGIVLVAAFLALVGVGGFFAWRWLLPPRSALVTPTPAPAPSPEARLPPVEPRPSTEATPAPAPPIEEAVTIVRSPSPKAPSPSPSGAKPSPPPKGAATPAPAATPAGPSAEELRAQQVAGLVGQAESAAARPEEALRLYDEALKLDPQNARALAGRSAAQAAASRKRFAAGRTLVQGGKAKADLSGFDSADVQVSDAPGRIDFEVAPASVKPGDGYTVRIFFQNDAKKTLKLRSLSASTLTNGAPSGGSMTPRVREIAPQQRALIQELSGVWKDGTASWTLDVVLVSERNDTYRNQVSWK